VSGEGRLAIAVQFDLICPWCFIGMRQLELARTRFAQHCPQVIVDTAWNAVPLLPEIPEEGVPFAEFYERRLGSPAAVQLRLAQVERAAKSAGLTLHPERIRRMPNTARAHALLRRVGQLHEPGLYEALLERLFAAHFQYGEDIGDEACLRTLALEAGVPPEVPAGPAPEADVAAPLPAAEAAAIVGVPYFAFNGRLFLSGAHDASVLFTAMSLAAGAPGTMRLADASCRETTH